MSAARGQRTHHQDLIVVIVTHRLWVRCYLLVNLLRVTDYKTSLVSWKQNHCSNCYLSSGLHLVPCSSDAIPDCHGPMICCGSSTRETSATGDQKSWSPTSQNRRPHFQNFDGGRSRTCYDPLVIVAEFTYVVHVSFHQEN